MTMSIRLKNFLDHEHVKYDELWHPKTNSPLETAQSQQIPGKKIAKAVIIKSEDHYLMCVVSAISYIDFQKLSKLTHTNALELADENEITQLFPFYEVGAEPPFADDSGLEVYVDKMLSENDEICFNAGTHVDMVEMKFEDYVRLAKPIIGDFSRRIKGQG